MSCRARRRVRQFDRSSYGTGGHAVAWDGRDAAGRPVPAGVYFSRLRANGVSETQKLTFLGW